MRFDALRTRLRVRRTLRPARPTARLSPGKEDEMVVEAGPVTLRGPRGQVEHAVAAGLYGEPPHAKPMSREEDHVMTGVYIGVGLLLAAGAGYLAWRYVLSDEQKVHAKDLLADTATKAKRAVRDAKGRIA